MIKDIPKDVLMKMYRDLLTARMFDDTWMELYRQGHMGNDLYHRGVGEEAIEIGICANLRKDDYIKLTSRTRFILFAKGISKRDVIASKAYRDVIKDGGHYTYYDHEYGVIPYSGTLGEDVMVATGCALAEKLKKTDRVTVAIFGDGTGNRGSIHESMAVAAMWKLPIIFVMQNNQYGYGMPVRENYVISDISDRAKAYGFPGVTIDGNDVIEVYEVFKEYIGRARRGEGAAFIVAETFRLHSHFEGDRARYRPEGEPEEWWKKDPLPRYEDKLMEMGIIDQSYINKLKKEIKAELDKAAATAIALPKVTREEYLKTAVAEL